MMAPNFPFRTTDPLSKASLGGQGRIVVTVGFGLAILAVAPSRACFSSPVCSAQSVLSEAFQTPIAPVRVDVAIDVSIPATVLALPSLVVVSMIGIVVEFRRHRLLVLSRMGGLHGP